MTTINREQFRVLADYLDSDNCDDIQVREALKRAGIQVAGRWAVASFYGKKNELKVRVVEAVGEQEACDAAVMATATEVGATMTYVRDHYLLSATPIKDADE